MLPNIVQITIFWIVQASALLVFTVPFRWPLVGLWAISHFVRAVGLTLLFHRYLAHRAFKMNRVARFVWAFIGTAAMQKGPLWWAGHHVNHHKYADRDGDPHSPMISGFYYAHIGWFLHDTKYDTLEPSNPVIARFRQGARARAHRAVLHRPADPAGRRGCTWPADGRGWSTDSVCRR